MKNPSRNALVFDNPTKKGAVIRKPGSKNLYVLFYYFGKRVEKSTGLKDTPENERKVRDWLDRQMSKIEDGKFVFANAFPGASEQEKGRFAKFEGWQYQPEPRDILFGDYAQRWLTLVWPAGKTAPRRMTTART